MPDPALPTSADGPSSALRRLQDTKDFIDRHILDELRQVPAALNNAAPAGDGPVADLGATHFGLHPAGVRPGRRPRPRPAHQRARRRPRRLHRRPARGP